MSKPAPLSPCSTRREKERQSTGGRAPMLGSDILASMPFNWDSTLGEITLKPLPSPHLPQSLVDAPRIERDGDTE